MLNSVEHEKSFITSGPVFLFLLNERRPNKNTYSKIFMDFIVQSNADTMRVSFEYREIKMKQNKK